MANTKISDLTALTTPVSGDLFPIIDVSDTTMAASGTNKKVTLTNLEANLTVTNMLGLGTGVATFLATPSSANLASAVTGETGSGALVFGTAPTFTTSITTPSVLASANDSGALGASGTAFSDLFLASGGVINWNAGNATLTHSTGLLTSNVDISVPDEAYDATAWNGSLEVPTKNAVRDKIESLTGGSSTSVDSTQSVYSNFEIEFSGSGATPTGDTWDTSAMNTATRWNGKLLRATFGTNSYITQFLPGNIGASSAFLQFGNGKDIIVSFNAKFSSVTGQVGIGIADSTDVFYAVSTSAGKMVVTYDGTTLNAVSGETSNTTTNIGSGITATNWNNYRIHYTYGSNVKFYINNTLVATHSTNLPTSSSNARFGIGGATTGKTTEVGNVVVSIKN